MSSDNTSDKAAVPRSNSRYNRKLSRSQKVKRRQRQAEKQETIFFRAVFSLAGATTAFALVLVYIASIAVEGVSGEGGLSGLADLSRPWLGPLSKLELLGGIGVAVLFFIFWRRVRKR